MLKRYIGDRAFYRRAMRVAVPIVIQSAITNLVSLLDNIMVAQVGEAQMSGVSIVNQLMFIFNLCIFGANAGAGIFTAQFHGNNDAKGIRHTFRFKLMVCTGLVAVWCGLFLLAGTPLLSQYLQGDGSAEEAASILSFGEEYLGVILWGLLPFAISNAYSGTLRETGNTVIPMVGSVTAVFVNLILNYVLIFGHLGAPAMGVSGAALATVISRFTELAIVAGWTHFHSKKCPFIKGAYRSMYVPGKLLGSIVRKGSPLLINECMFAIGMAITNQCYTTCGLDVVPAMNINNTVWNLVSVSYLAMGNSVGIIMGQMLGAGTDEAGIRDANRKLTFLSLSCGVVFGAVAAAGSHLFPLMFNTTKEVASLAGWLILISAVMIPFNAYVHASYFTLRSGGKTGITFLFDSGFMWGLLVPLAFVLSRFTSIGILPLYAICQCVEIVKSIAGYFMVRSGMWIQNLAK